MKLILSIAVLILISGCAYLDKSVEAHHVKGTQTVYDSSGNRVGEIR